MTKKQPLHIYEILAGLFITTLIVSNIASIKLVSVGSFVFDAGTILFPLAYIIGDIITEVYGFKRMRYLLYVSIAMLILTSVTFYVVGLLPGASDWTGQGAYDQILGVVWRIVLASCVAIFVGELVNSYVLARLKIRDKGAKLWRRVIGSSVVGNLVDTTVFSVIAFAGIFPTSTLLTLIATVYLIKILTEIVLSPITIRAINAVKRHEKIDTFETPSWKLNS